MAFRKYQKTEKVETVSPAKAEQIARLKKEAGVKSARDLSPEARKSLRDN